MATRARLFAAVSAIIALISLGTIMFHHMEKWSWVSSFYFSVTTLTTVGYGDLYPTTEASRLFAAFYILLGVAITLAALAIIGSDYLQKRERRILRRSRKNDRRKGMRIA